MILNAADNIEKFRQIAHQSGFIGRKIWCDYLTENGVDGGGFFIINDCVFMHSGENISLCGKPTDEDISQILSYAYFFNVQSIESQIMDITHGSIKKIQLLYEENIEDTCCVNIKKNKNIYLFTKFCCESFEDINFDTVYSYFAKKVNKSLANIYYIEKDDKIISGAVATRYSEKEIYVTFVSTDKEHRNCGLARRVISHIKHEYQKENLCLLCENELVEFYKKIGFKPTDTITINTLKGNIYD